MLSKIARVLLGLIYFVFGLNGFISFLPTPPLPEAAMTFVGGLMSADYFLPLLKGSEVICGALLILGFAAPVALVILAPITINIFLFHLYLTPGLENIILPSAMVALHIFSALAYRNKFRPLFA